MNIFTKDNINALIIGSLMIVILNVKGLEILEETANDVFFDYYSPDYNYNYDTFYISTDSEGTKYIRHSLIELNNPFEDLYGSELLEIESCSLILFAYYVKFTGQETNTL